MRARRVVGIVALTLLAIPVLLLVLANTPVATRFALNKVLPKLNEQLNGRLTYEGASGSLLRGINLRGVTLRDPEGEIVLQAQRVAVGYSLWDILHGRIDLGPVLLEKPIIRLLKGHPGEQYSILRVFAKENQSVDTASSSVELRIRDVTLRDGTVLAAIWRNPADPQRERAQQLDTLQLLNVNLELPLLSYASGSGRPRAAALEIASGRAWLPDPALDLQALSGTAQLLGDSISVSLKTVQLPSSKLTADAWLVTAPRARRFDATARVEELKAGDIASLISGAEIPADWSFHGTLRASSHASGAIVIASPDLNITAAGGNVRGHVSVVGADNEWTPQKSRVTVSSVEVHRLLRAFDIRSDLRATVNGVVTADGRQGEVDLRLAGLSGYGVRNAVRGYVHATGNLDALALDTRLTGDAGTIVLAGQAAMGKHLRLDRVRGTLERVNLSAVDARMPRSNLNARFEGDVVFGSLPREGHLKLFVDSSTIDAVRIDTAVVIATEHEGLLTVDSLFIRAPGLQAKGSGTFGIHEDQTGAFTLTLDAPSLSEVEPLLAALTRDTVFDIAGTLQARLSAKGSLNEYTLGLEARGSDIAVKGFEIEAFDAKAEGMPDALTFTANAAVDSETKVSLGGRRSAQAIAIAALVIERGKATWQLDDNADIEYWNGQLRLSNAVLRRSGASGTVTLAGTYPENLTVTIDRLPMVDIVPSSKADSLPDLNARATLANGAWSGTVGLVLDNREPLRADFATNPLRGKLTADSFDLATVAPLISTIRNLGGRLDGSVDVAGTRDAPRLTGTLQLVNATATVPATGVRYTDIDAGLNFSGDAVTLEGVEVAAGKGTAQLTGRIRFARLDRPELDITTRIQRFPVMNRRDFIEATATGELRLQGSAGGATLAGRATVDHGTAFLERFTRASGIDLSDPLYAQFVDTTVLRREALSPGLIEAFVDTLRIDNLSVDLGDNFWLRSPDASIQLAGRVAVSTAGNTNNGDKYDLFGTIRAERGIYRLAFAPGLTREFTIREGAIRYYGSPKTDATLDLTAEHVIKTATGDRVTITAHFGGTMAVPTIALTSDVTPQLSETEIISYLVFGAPTVQAFLGREGGESQRQSVFGKSAEQLVSVLSGKIENAVISGLGLPIDYFRIKPGEVQSGLAGTELVLGMQVRILGFPSFLRASPRFCPRERLLALDHVGIDLETRLAPQWGVATSVDPVQGCEAAMSGVSAKPYQFGVDLFWEKR